MTRLIENTKFFSSEKLFDKIPTLLAIVELIIFGAWLSMWYKLASIDILNILASFCIDVSTLLTDQIPSPFKHLKRWNNPTYELVIEECEGLRKLFEGIRFFFVVYNSIALRMISYLLLIM